MFKKPLSNLKTSAPLRSSDRRKLKQRIASTYAISSEDGDILVPDGILSLKFSTYLDEPGVSALLAYAVNDEDSTTNSMVFR
jgi:translation initiation factor 2D